MKMEQIFAEVKKLNEIQHSKAIKNVDVIPDYSNKVFTTLIKNFNQAIIIVDSGYTIKWFNTNASGLWELYFSLELKKDADLRDFLPENLANTIARNITNAFVKKNIIQEKKILCKNNKIVWLHFDYIFLNENCDMPEILISIKDISEAKATIDSLQLHDSILEAVSFAAEKFLRTADFREVLDEVFQKLGTSARVKRIYLVEYKDESGKLIFEWLDKPDKDVNNISYKSNNPFHPRWIPILQKGNVVRALVKNLPSEEKNFFESLNVKFFLAVPIFVGEMLWGYIGFDDYTERKWTLAAIGALKTAGQILGAAIQRLNFEEELISAKEEAEKSNLLKTEFLAQMSHEIRTPVNSILSFTSLLKDELENNIECDLNLYFKMIDNGGRRLIRTIDMILNMSLIQVGGYNFNPTKICLKDDILEPIVYSFKHHAKEKGLTLSFNSEIDNDFVFADNYSVIQIFTNLIDNAIKYTEDGSVAINLYKKNNDICISIADTGIGISKDYLPLLFTPFTQEETGYTRRYEGNGLGLALVKKYLELNKGSIRVISKKNIGTTFTVIFPQYKNE